MARSVDKRGRNITRDHWTKLVRGTLNTPAWRALSPKAQALYPWIKFEWKGAQNNNNGKIQLSCRQAADAMGIGVNAAIRAFRELQAKGFIHITKMGALGVQGEARGPSYEITEIPLPGSEKHQGRRLFLEWREGRDFSVAQHNVNNPSWHNGRSFPSSGSRRTHHHIRDVQPEPVIVTKTARLQNGDVEGWKKATTVIKMKTSLNTIPSAQFRPPNLSLPVCPSECPERLGRAD